MPRASSVPGILTKVASMVLAALVLAGCGSSDDETTTFDEDGFGITFEYPADFQRTDDVNIAQVQGAGRRIGGAGLE